MAIPSNPVLINALIETATAIADADHLIIDQAGIHKKITGLDLKASLGTVWSQNPDNTIFYNTNNVGIGSNTPQEKLHVLGNGRFDGDLAQHNAAGTIRSKFFAATGWLAIRNAVAEAPIHAVNSSDGNVMKLRADGGTGTNDGNMIELRSSSADTTAKPGIDFKIDTTTMWKLFHDFADSNSINFGRSGTSSRAWRLAASGTGLTLTIGTVNTGANQIRLRRPHDGANSGFISLSQNRGMTFQNSSSGGGGPRREAMVFLVGSTVASPHGFKFRASNNVDPVYFNVKLPTSATGLLSGDMWRSGTQVMIVA